MDTPSVPLGLVGVILPFPLTSRVGGLDLRTVNRVTFRVFQPDGEEVDSWTGALDSSPGSTSATALYTFAGTEFGYPASSYPGTWRIAPVLYTSGGPPAGYAVEGADLRVTLTP